jgi:D-beta-D-heptose 7-phosphate kinase/D-beta-D-heptose 1-phosphate adenosyltransferase
LVGIIDGEWFEYSPQKKIEAISVIGAGDCFVAFLALALGCGFDIAESAEIAFEAGAVYVQRKYNKPVSPSDLISSSKKVDVSLLRKMDCKLVFTNGCFDILHVGHLELLRKAKTFGDKLVVAVNSDESIQRLKGDGRPINCLEDRMEMLASLEFVDFVVSFEEDTPYNLIQEIMPEVLVKGKDWNGNVVGSDLVKQVEIVEMIPGRSTTKIIEKVKDEYFSSN